MQVKIRGNLNEVQNKDLSMFRKEVEALLKCVDYLPQSVMEKFKEDNEILLRNLKNELIASNDSPNLLWKINAVFRLNSTRVMLTENMNEKLFPNGMMFGELYVLTAVSGGGKTSFSCALASSLISGFNYKTNLESNVTPVLYLSLEQTKNQIQARIMSNLLALFNIDKNIPFSSLLFGGVTNFQSIDKAVGMWNLFSNQIKILDLLDFSESPDVFSVINKIQEYVNIVHKTPVVFIDRYENIVGSNDFSDDVVARELKRFAEKANVPIILQAQLNKSSINAAKDKDGKINIDLLSGNSLKGNSGLEHNATNILIIAPEGKTRIEDGEEEKMVIIAQPKSRYGFNESIKMWFRGSCGLFTDFNETRGRKKKEEKDDEETRTNQD